MRLLESVRLSSLSLVLLAILLEFGLGCRADIPTGIFACTTQADCPRGTFCSRNTQRCEGQPDDQSSSPLAVAGNAGDEGVAGVGSPVSGTGGSGGHPTAGDTGSVPAGRGGAGGENRGVGGGAGRATAGNAGLGAPAGMGGSGGAAGSGTGSSCPTDGAMRCAATGGGRREQCVKGIWTEMSDCPSGQICSSPADAPASCVAVSDICRGSEGKAVCDAAGKLSVCNSDGSLGSETQCKSAKHCQAGLAAESCATCIANQEFHCDGSTLQVCAADGGSFTMKTVCGSAALCNESAGMCTASVCSAGQYGCQANTLVKCNSSGSGYDSMTPCGTASCDATGGDCNMCEPGQKSCDSASANGVLTCNASGQGFDKSSCAGTQKCAGAGQCVDCVSSADCGAGKTCQNSKCVCAPSCSGKQCGNDGCGGTCGTCTAAGTACNSSGQCTCVPSCTGKQCGNDGCGGSCGTCGSSLSCNASGACVTTCGNSVVDPGETCDDGNTDATDACINCQKAFCGDGYIQTGVEQCDPNAFAWSGKCDNQCKRTIYTPCPMGNECSASTHCATFTSAAQSFCSESCSTAGNCSGVPGYSTLCDFGNCGILCNNRTCPLGMGCAPNIPVIDPMTGTTTMMVDVCVVQN